MTASAESNVEALDTRQLLALFSSLETPPLDEMNGEFRAKGLKQDSLLASISFLGFSNPVWPGKWLAKGFQPVDGATGRGYNLFLHFGREVQRFPMQTLLAPSRYDGKPAYQLVYGAYGSVCGAIRMVDEIRRLRPGVYLGIGTCGFVERQRRIPYPFLLSGPAGAYRGHIGARRA